MKVFVKNIVMTFSRITTFFIHPFFIKTITFIIINITTQYVIKQLKQCGVSPLFFFPIKTFGLKYITIGDNFFVDSHFTIEAYDEHMNSVFNPKIIIGNNVRIGAYCHIGCVNYISIGNNVLIASKVFITDHFHGDTRIESLQVPPNDRTVTSKGPVIIEDNVWIGEGVAIMPNVTIGKNSIIGANAVVTKSCPPNSVLGGVPAVIIKMID